MTVTILAMAVGGESMNFAMNCIKRYGLSVGLATALTLLTGAVIVAEVSASEPPKSLDLVILVDESSSLSEADVVREIKAVKSLVTRRELSGEYVVQIAIAGFGSGEDAVSEKCPLREVSVENVRDFEKCADGIVRRSIRGQHTDFAKAFKYASDVFRTAKSKSDGRAVILLTDGKYDPSGKRGTGKPNSGELDDLRQSTDALRDYGAQIWPLGFGQVVEDELQELARSGALSQCPAAPQPRAIIAEGESLDTYILEILSATLCKKIIPPRFLPTEFDVHPFVDSVTLTVRGVTDNPEVKIMATGKMLCLDEWLKASDDSLMCQIDVAGSDVGKWLITSSGNTSDGSRPRVENSYDGRIDLRLEPCEANDVAVLVSRADGTAVQWGAVNWKKEVFPFPLASIEGSGQSQSALLNASKVTLKTGQLAAGEASIAVKLAENQVSFIWLKASKDTCKILSPTTTVAATVPVTIPSVIDDGDGDGVPWLLGLLLLALLGGSLWLLRRRSANGKFPIGAELKQKNTTFGDDVRWNSRADLGGLRKVALSFGQGGWLSESDANEADVIVQRSRRKKLGDFVIIKLARPGIDGTADSEGPESFHSFAFESDTGIGIIIRASQIRVEIPTPIDDDDFEEDDNE